MAYKGIRVRVRRTRDNLVLYDSGNAVSNVTELFYDVSSYVGTEGYAIDACYVTDGAATTANMPAPLCRRQVLVLLGLHK